MRKSAKRCRNAFYYAINSLFSFQRVNFTLLLIFSLLLRFHSKLCSSLPLFLSRDILIKFSSAQFNTEIRICKYPSIDRPAIWLQGKIIHSLMSISDPLHLHRSVVNFSFPKQQLEDGWIGIKDRAKHTAMIDVRSFLR